MRRSLWSRASAAAIGLWLAVSVSEPAFLHSCPVHGGHVSSHVMRGGMSDDTMAEHASPVSHHETDSHTCTCISSCCCAAPIGLAGPAVSLAVIGPSAVRDTGLPEYLHVPVAATHVLPFANGPPAIV